MKSTMFAAMMFGLVASFPMSAVAGGHAAPQGAGSSKPPSQGAAPRSMPANPTFVERQNGFTWTMRIDGLGKFGDEDGFIQYDKYDFEKANVVSNVSVQGIIGVKGVGEALKKHLMALYKESVFESDLIKTNRERLLTLWSKSYPNAPSSSELRDQVPALATKFGDDFDFEIKAFPSKSGGNIHLWVKPKGSGAVTILNPDALNKMVLDDPELRPASAKGSDEAKKKEEAEKKKEEAEAKKEEEAEKKKAEAEAKKKKDDDAKHGKGKGH